MNDTTNKRVVLAFGTFDRLHLGHVHFLEQAKKYGGHLVVGVARDVTVVKIKGHLPHHGEKERVQALKYLNIADRVVLGSTKDYLAIIKRVQPDVVCLGYDQEAMVPLLQAYKTVSLPKLKIVRSKPLEELRYKSSLIPKSATLPLARGLVVAGKGEGRKLGYPTANIHAPRAVRRAYDPGIYASEIYVQGKVYQGATVVGVRMEDGAPLVETHIVDQKKNFYGKTITVVLDVKIRNTKRYTTREALIQDIKKDIDYVHRYYSKPRDRKSAQ